MTLKKLIINPPKLTVLKGVARVECKINEEDDTGKAIEKTVTFDVDEKWVEYLVTENVNAYLVACLPYAMRNRMNIELLAPVSSELLHNIEMYLIPHLVKYDDRLHATEIIASQIETTRLDNAGAVGTGMSMGVDSFHTVHQYINPKYTDLKLTHLFVEQVGGLLDGATSTKHMRNVNPQTVDDVAEALGLPVVYSYSNLRQLFRMNHRQTHTYTSMFNIHMLAKLFRVYFYASAEDFGHFNLIDSSTKGAGSYELLSLQALSTTSLRLMSGGAASDRIEKTKDLANSDVARKFLRVCLHEELNCMDCVKCRRTLLTLDMLGNIDMFGEAFDIPKYRERREDYLKWLLRTYHRDSEAISIKDLYKFFTASEQDTMKRLEAWCLENYEPMRLPRYLRASRNIQKENPSTGRKYLGITRKGQDIYFVDALYVNGVCYLRSKEDSDKNRSRAIPMNYLETINYRPLKALSRRRVTRDVKKLDPRTGLVYGLDVKAGTEISFSDSITVDGVVYLRSQRDYLAGKSLAIPVDSTAEMVS